MSLHFLPQPISRHRTLPPPKPGRILVEGHAYRCRQAVKNLEFGRVYAGVAVRVNGRDQIMVTFPKLIDGFQYGYADPAWLERIHPPAWKGPVMSVPRLDFDAARYRRAPAYIAMTCLRGLDGLTADEHYLGALDGYDAEGLPRFRVINDRGLRQVYPAKCFAPLNQERLYLWQPRATALRVHTGLSGNAAKAIIVDEFGWEVH